MAGLPPPATNTVLAVCTIIAKNLAGTAVGLRRPPRALTTSRPDIFGNFFDRGSGAALGHNLIDNRAGGTRFQFGGVSELVRGNGHPVTDPRLRTTAPVNNGGLTPMHGLMPTSPAVGRGRNSANRLFPQRRPSFRVRPAP